MLVRVEREGDEAVIRVQDNGMGISAEPCCQKVFDLFTQGDRALDRQSGGLGIGLALVRRSGRHARRQRERAQRGVGHTAPR